MQIMRYIILLKPLIVKILICSIAMVFLYIIKMCLMNLLFFDFSRIFKCRIKYFSHNINFLYKHFLFHSVYRAICYRSSRGQLRASCDHEFILITSGRHRPENNCECYAECLIVASARGPATRVTTTNRVP